MELLEHREAFIQTLRDGPHVWKRIFDTLEASCAQDLESGRGNRNLYEVLYSAVHDAGEPEALKEFENRFLPLLNRSRSRSKAKSSGAAIADEDPTSSDHNRVRGWTAPLCAVVLVVGGLAVGLIVLNTLMPDPPSRIKSPVSRAQVIEPIRTITEVEPAQPIEAEAEH
jgi:hypothetical protein